MRSHYKGVARFMAVMLLVSSSLLAWPSEPRTLTALSVSSVQEQEEARVPMLFGSAPDAPDSELQAIVQDVLGELPGTWGVAVKKLDTGQYAVLNGDTQQVAASLYKMWVLAELFRQAKAGIVDLDAYVSVTGSDAWYDAMLDDLRLPAGTSITLRRAAYLMVTVSDNTAAALLVRVLGPDNINRFMQQNGLSNSLLDWSGVGDNLTTPRDVLREMEMLATSRMVDAAASRQMVDIMLDQQVNNLLAPGLPDGTPFAHKHGALNALLHDAGIVWGPSGPFVIVVMSSHLDSFSTAWDNMPRLMGRVYEYFNSSPSSPALYFPETRQTVGHDFLKYWHTHGGKAILGLPLTAEQMRDGLLSQTFERVRLELHPASSGSSTGAGRQMVVVPANLGQERAAQLGLGWPRNARPGDLDDGQYFEETGQAVRGGFYEFWLNHGGEAVFGLPISPEAEMMSPADGNTYVTQWFQRARMEYHPELPEGQRITLGHLGSELDARKP